MVPENQILTYGDPPRGYWRSVRTRHTCNMVGHRAMPGTKKEMWFIKTKPLHYSKESSCKSAERKDGKVSGFSLLPCVNWWECWCCASLWRASLKDALTLGRLKTWQSSKRVIGRWTSTLLCCLCLCPYKRKSGRNTVVMRCVYFMVNLGFWLSNSKLGHLTAK